MKPDDCQHMNFGAFVDVHRIPREEGGPVDAYQCDVRVVCVDCKLPFHFLGLPLGLDLHGAAVSPDRTEARLAIAPGAAPIPKSGTMRFNVGRGPEKGGSA